MEIFLRSEVVESKLSLNIALKIMIPLYLSLYCNIRAKVAFLDYWNWARTAESTFCAMCKCSHSCLNTENRCSNDERWLKHNCSWIVWNGYDSSVIVPSKAGTVHHTETSVQTILSQGLLEGQTSWIWLYLD